MFAIHTSVFEGAIATHKSLAVITKETTSIKTFYDPVYIKFHFDVTTFIIIIVYFILIHTTLRGSKIITTTKRVQTRHTQIYGAGCVTFPLEHY